MCEEGCAEVSILMRHYFDLSCASLICTHVKTQFDFSSNYFDLGRPFIKIKIPLRPGLNPLIPLSDVSILNTIQNLKSNSKNVNVLGIVYTKEEICR